jgi:predicted peptidase
MEVSVFTATSLYDNPSQHQRNYELALFVTEVCFSGQGTWYALSHRPDKIVAAAPVSGYSSIQSKLYLFPVLHNVNLLRIRTV